MTAALGLALHFVIAFAAAAVFYAARRKLRFMTRQPVISGVAYGVGVYPVMYWIAVVTHVVCVGLPTSLVVSRFSR